jgi:hypothetical protein
MSRERFIDPGMWTSAQVCSVEPMARLLFVGMITTADDEGRGGAALVKLKASIFPADTISLQQIGTWRTALAQSGLIRLYSASGQEVYDLPSWKRWQKPRYVKPSTIPAYHICTESVQIGAPGVVGLGVVGSGGDGSAESKSTPAAPTPAAEPDAGSPAEVAGLTEIPIELVNFPEFLTDRKLVARWEELYRSWKNDCPSVEIMDELRQAHAHAVKKKAMGAPYRNFVRYLASWMMRQQDESAKYSRGPKRSARPAALPLPIVAGKSADDAKYGGEAFRP